jgi:hypothetical protein
MRNIVRLAALATWILCAIAGTAFAAGAAIRPDGNGLAKGFASPPASARPWVYWFWLDGNITREGITADLEAMRRVGIGGVLIMEVDQGIPKGPVRFASPPWREMFKHVVAEAGRLGLQVNMNNDAGWCGSGGPWNTPEHAMQKLVGTETTVEGPQHFDATLPNPEVVAGFYRDIAVLAFPMPGDFRIENIRGKSDFERYWGLVPAHVTEPPAAMVISRDRVFDLSARLTQDGRLAWEVPQGKWTLLRIGYTPTGKDNHPAPLEGRGLECDKLSQEAMDAHFAGLMGKLIADVGPAAGKTLALTHIDSWEVHSQNWTPRFREEFRKRRGYDPLPYLPAMTGRVVGSLEISERFLGDVRRTVQDLLLDNYAGRLRALAHQHGMRLSIEAYGDGPFDCLSYAGRADIPMSEFWVGGGALNTCKTMASAAHVYGKPIVAAESFTADPSQGKWQNHPASLKALGDQAFCLGVNRFVVHRYALQPWLKLKPGMTMGPWGVHYERTETWWEQSAAWHRYVSRCQYLLQQGRFVADLCYLESEDAPNDLPWRDGLQPPPPPGYDYDGCTPEVVLSRMSVKNGMLVLPDGMSYRLLVLPPGELMTPVLLRRIKALVQAGATIVGARPTKSPSLTGYPRCDDEVKSLAAELWGNCDGKIITRHRCGTGMVVWGEPLDKILAGLGVRPDFICRGQTAFGSIHYIHRNVGGADVYFVANASPQPQDVVCAFRVAGKRPELWRPDSGRIEKVAVYDESGCCVRVPIRFDPSGSVFVVFRNPALGVGAGLVPAPLRATTHSARSGQARVAPTAHEGARRDRIISVTRGGETVLSTAWPRRETAADNNRNITNNFTMAVWVKPATDIELPQEADAGGQGLGYGRNDLLYPPPGHEVYGEGHAGAGISVGRNGVCVYEHSASYFAPILVYATPLANWTHVVVAYRDGRPSLYINGKFVHTGLKSRYTVHPGVGVEHGRSVAPFRGDMSGLRQFDRSLTEAEIARLTQPTRPNPERLTLPAINIVRGERSRLDIECWQPGTYRITTAGRIRLRGLGVGAGLVPALRRATTHSAGSEPALSDAKGQARVAPTTDEGVRTFRVRSLPEPLAIVGPWQVRFPPNWGAPDEVTFNRLISWTESTTPGIKYFSGTATYVTRVNVAPGLVRPSTMLGAHPERGRRVRKGNLLALDLGEVREIAEVRLNGKDLGILWKPPFRVDVTDTIKAGANLLEIRVTNLWPNRLIGDEQLPDDCEWLPGGPLKAWPAWLVEGKPRPTQRRAFTTWKHYAKDSPLLESGLLGPVRLLVGGRVALAGR